MASSVFDLLDLLLSYPPLAFYFLSLAFTATFRAFEVPYGYEQGCLW